MDMEFPLFLSEIFLQSINYFRFMMPQQEIGRDDVEIFIEYGDAIDGKPELACNIWARVGNSRIKGFITTIRVPKPSDPEENMERIVSALNQDEDFIKGLDEFIAFMTKK